MTTKILVSHVSWSMLSHLFSRGSMMLSAVLLARFLTEHDFAVYSYFQMTATMIATYAAMGLGVTASKFFAELNHENEEKRTDVIKSIGTLWVLSIGLAFAAALVVFLIPIASLTSGLNIPVWLFALCVLVMALDIIPSGGILGLEQYKKVALISFFTGCINLIGAYISTKKNLPIYSMWALVMGCATQAFGEMYVIRRSVGWSIFFRLFVFDYSKLKNVFSFVGPMFLVSVMAGSGTWILGKIILNGSDGKHEFALYSIGLQWFSLALFIPGMISRVVLPRLIRSKRNDNQNTLYLSGAMALTASIAFAIIGIFFRDLIMSLYGSEYAMNSSSLILLYLLAAIFYAPANTLGNALVAHGYQLIWLFITMVWFFAVLITGFLFVDLGSEMGAYAQMIGGLVMLISSIFFCRKYEILR
jgi:O-antigen/teichoic acid export membrane protein